MPLQSHIAEISSVRLSPLIQYSSLFFDSGPRLKFKRRSGLLQSEKGQGRESGFNEWDKWLIRHDLQHSGAEEG